MGATIPNIHLLTNAKVLGPLLKERIDDLLGLLLFYYSRGRGHLLALGLLSFRLQARNTLCLVLSPKHARLEKLPAHPRNAFIFLGIPPAWRPPMLALLSRREQILRFTFISFINHPEKKKD